MTIRDYDRSAAVAYARKWAFGRNPDYFDFNNIGGDCTNFASQCVYAGSGVMNFTPTYGWFYKTANDRTPSWTGVQYFYDFMTKNKGPGPFAAETDLSGVMLGDLIQLGRGNDDYYHTPIVTGFSNGRILVAAHSYDAYDRPLDTYSFERYRCIHILGVRE